jgi:hypothetical protein
MQRPDFTGQAVGGFLNNLLAGLAQQQEKSKQLGLLNQAAANPNPAIINQMNPDTFARFTQVRSMNQPQFMNVPAGASVVQKNPDGSVRPIFQSAQKQSQTSAKINKYTALVGDKPHVFRESIDANGQRIGDPVDLGEAPQSLGIGGAATVDAKENGKEIAQSIIDGLQPPDMKGNYRAGPYVKRFLAEKGYDFTTASRDWQAITRFMSTLNGPQQVRLKQAIDFTNDTIPQIEELWGKLKATGLPTGYKMWNKAALTAAKNLPGDAGSIANNLDALLADFTSELGTVYKGGNSSTDESLKIAATNLKSEWNPQTFDDAIKRLKRTLVIRKNSIYNSIPSGVSQNTPYLKGVNPQRGGDLKSKSDDELLKILGGN